MRLLHVHSGNLYGGVETMLVTMARHPAPASLTHEFALCFEGRLASELRAAGATVYPLGATRTRSIPSVLRARRRLRGLLGDGRCDAAACHMPWSQALFGSTVQSRGVPQIFWMHGAVAGCHWLERWARRTPPDLAICNSAYTATTLPALYRGILYEILYPPVELSAASRDPGTRIAKRRELATPADAVVIIQVSRIEPLKGHRVHLEALSQLRHLPGWVCWIVGGARPGADARYLATLRTRGVELGIADRVRFCGERSDVSDLLDAADIFCQPNLGADAFGIVFVEALAAGLPVVTADLGGAVEIVDSSCGLTVPSNDPERLAEVLHRLIADAPLRARLGAAGPCRAVQLCDPAARLAELAAIVEQLATTGPGGAWMES